MATQIFSITQLGYDAARTAAYAVADPKHVWEDRPTRFVVLTGDDIPVTTNPSAVTLNKMQLFQGARLAGGTALIDAFESFFADAIANGINEKKINAKYCAEFRREMPFINQLRLFVKGTKTVVESREEMDQVFILGSGYTP